MPRVYALISCPARLVTGADLLGQRTQKRDLKEQEGIKAFVGSMQRNQY